MAILKNLVVNGSSRFLNTAYFQDVSIGGAATFASISASGNITAGGNLYSTTGNLYLKNLLAINGQTDSWLRINANKAFTSGVYFGSSNVKIDANVQVGNNGSNLNIVYNATPANGSFTVGSPATFNSTVTSTSITNSGKLISNTIDCQEIRWTKAEEITVADLGGTFIVAPTIYFTEGSTSVNVTAISGTTVTMSITDNAINSADLGGHTWKQYSKIKLSGAIGDCVLGSADGYLSAQLNTTSHVANVIATIANASKLTVNTTYSGANVKNLAMMMYAVGNGSTSNTYKVGMVLTSYGDNYRSYLDIYSGGSNTSVTRIGNLGGLTYDGSTLSNQWGLLTTNGYFTGTVTANAGHLGTSTNGFVIDANGIYYGSRTSNTSGYFGLSATSDFTRTINGTSRTDLRMALGQNFGVSATGTLYAGSAVISGDITANTGYIGGTSGWTIASQQLSSGTLGVDNSLYLGTKNLGSNTSIGGRSGSDWRLTVGSKFGVTNTGALYASSVDLTGKITATSGTIGGCSITDGVLYVADANISGKISSNHINASGITIGQSQVTNLTTDLGNKASSSDLTALSNKVTAVYGTCDTTATNGTKAITLSNFTLYDGAVITILFNNANTNKNIIYLNVNSTGAKKVYVNNVCTSSSGNSLLWGANTIMTFRYTNSNYHLLDNPKTWYGTSSTNASTSVKTATITNCVICKNTIVKLLMSYETTSDATYLNINSTVNDLYIYAHMGSTNGCPTTSNGYGWGANTVAEFMFDGSKWWLVGISDASTTATNYITEITNGGIKVSYTTNPTNYLQITADGTSIYKDISGTSTQIASYGSSIILGQIANGITRVEIDSDSLDVISRANNIDYTVATFGETATIGDMNSRGVSINSSGFKFNNSGDTVFRVGVDQRTGKELYLSNSYTLSDSNESITINSKEYYLLATLPNNIDVITVGSNLLDPAHEDEMSSANRWSYVDWVKRDGKLWVYSDELIEKAGGTDDDACYIYIANASSLISSPYCVIGNSAYTAINPAGNMTFAQGYKNIASGAYSTSVGWQNLSSGVCSISSGNNSKAYGNNSFAGGISSYAYANNAFSYGNMSMACGENSIALGNQGSETSKIFTITVTNYNSNTYEITCNITEDADYFEMCLYEASILVTTDRQYTFESIEITSGSGTSNITFVCYTRGDVPSINDSLQVLIDPPGSYGDGAMSINSCCASDRLSTALGLGTTAPAAGLAIGMYNIPESNVLFSIGNGSGQFNRNNAMTVDMFGNAKATKFIGQQKVLWSGGYYMTQDHKPSLSEPVSAQANGIVLVWSGYTTAVQNYQWHFDFIPKEFVANHAGAGITCIMAGANFSPIATKYVYPYNTYVQGYTSNAATGTTNGITYANNKFVLRYILGV